MDAQATEDAVNSEKLQEIKKAVSYEKQPLIRARRYEEAMDGQIKKEARPAFHLSPRAGWMNDPNGFSVYKGRYHLFYQYYPYDTHWDSMHWGHAVSDDLLHWEYLPAALAPDKSYDSFGCFSGSALELSDGRQLLMYTGVATREQADGSKREIQTQCIAVGDGKDYEKYEKNPVLTGADLPEGSSQSDFRDPKIWRREDGVYCCVVGSRPADGSGQILLFTSADGFSWNFKSVLSENHNRFGLMWECPDFFQLDGKWILITSPQDMLAQGYEYRNGGGTLCLVGEFDGRMHKFMEESDQSLDYGVDFYAPQTVLSPDGRRIMIGWMQNWETCGLKYPDQLWFGQMSVPRELFLKNGRLCQRPVRELEAMRGAKLSYEDVKASGRKRLDGVKGRMIDLEVTVRPGNNGMDRHFALRFAEDENFYTSLSFCADTSVLTIDRRFSGVRKGVVHSSQCLINTDGGKWKLRLILDKFSAEAFVNDGEQALSMVLYTDPQADGITFFADKEIILDVVKYDLQ